MPFLVCMLVVGAWGVGGGWMPLPTRPQQYCDQRVTCFDHFWVPNSPQLHALVISRFRPHYLQVSQ